MKAVDCKTIRIFAYSSTREQSNKRSGTRRKTESETGRDALLACEARALRAEDLRHALLISLLIWRKKPTVLKSMKAGKHQSLKQRYCSS